MADTTNKIIGIDFGTTNSKIAIMQDDEPVSISNKFGGDFTPSFISCTKDGEFFIGSNAAKQAATNAINTVFSIKSLLGKCASDPYINEANLPYKIINERSKPLKIEISHQEFLPQELASMILKDLKESAELFLGHDVKDVIMTVPGTYTNVQRQAIIEAAKIADLNVKRIISDASAIALAYSYKHNRHETIAIYNMGGNEFNFSIYQIDNGFCEALGVNGLPNMGGDYIDDILIEHIVDNFFKDHSIDLKKNKTSLMRIKQAVEKAKVELSTSLTADIKLPFISTKQNEQIHLETFLSRGKLEILVEEPINNTIKCCDKTLKSIGLTTNDIDTVIVVGESTRIPTIKNKIQEFFKKEPYKGFNSARITSHGAAIQGAILGGSNYVNDMLIIEILPKSIGFEGIGGSFEKAISSNSNIPTKKIHTFSTSTDNQAAITKDIFQGEREMAVHNKPIGKLNIIGIPPAPRGVPQIDIAFEIDWNGILTIAHENSKTETNTTVVFDRYQFIHKDQIHRMTKRINNLLYKNSDFLDTHTKKKATQLLSNTRKLLKQLNKNISTNSMTLFNDAILELESSLKFPDTKIVAKNHSTLESLHDYLIKLHHATLENNKDVIKSKKQASELLRKIEKAHGQIESILPTKLKQQLEAIALNLKDKIGGVNVNEIKETTEQLSNHFTLVEDFLSVQQSD